LFDGAGELTMSQTSSGASESVRYPKNTSGRRSPWEIQRAVLFALVVRELMTRFGGTWYGAFWAVLEPFGHVAFMMVVFGVLRNRIVPGIDYPVFVIIGLIPFFMMRNIVFRLMEGIDANRGLLEYRQVKPIDALIARAMIEIALYAVIFALALLTLGMFGESVLPARPLEFISLWSALIAMGFALGLFFATATNEFPAARGFINIAFMPIYLMSGIIYPVRGFPQWMLEWVMWNPMVHVIELLRSDFFTNYKIDQNISLQFVLGFTLIALAVSLSLYRVRRHQLIKIR
jgi:capsular polysaccharide transport system permease protein